MNEPKWLEWAKAIQAISQAGLAYSKDAYDLERFESLRMLSVDIMAHYTEADPGTIRTLFASEEGYATPKSDVRAVVLQEGKMLLVREKLDGAWALPGGWADIGLSPSQTAVKETKEESGFDVRPLRLLAVLDKQFHDHPPSPWHVYKFFIQCEIIGGKAEGGTETSSVGFFGPDELPELSVERNTEAQVRRMFELAADPDSRTLVD